jgi:hypothetical protein
MKGFCRCTTSKSETPLKKPRKKRNSPKAEKQKSPKKLQNIHEIHSNRKCTNSKVKVLGFWGLGFRV